MKRIAFLLVLASGCGTSDDSGTVKDNSSTAAWTRIMSCSGGDAIVDVDQNERRSFQLVLKNSLIFPTFDQWTYGQIRNNSERIYRGSAIDGRGVFQPGEFVGFFANGVDGDRRGFKVKRGTSTAGHGGPTINLTFTAVDLSLCAGDLRDNDFPEECKVDSYEFILCKVQVTH